MGKSTNSSVKLDVVKLFLGSAISLILDLFAIPMSYQQVEAKLKCQV